MREDRRTVRRRKRRPRRPPPDVPAPDESSSSPPSAPIGISSLRPIVLLGFMLATCVLANDPARWVLYSAYGVVLAIVGISFTSPAVRKRPGYGAVMLYETAGMLGQAGAFALMRHVAYSPPTNFAWTDWANLAVLVGGAGWMLAPALGLRTQTLFGKGAPYERRLVPPSTQAIYDLYCTRILCFLAVLWGTRELISIATPGMARALTLPLAAVAMELFAATYFSFTCVAS